jgi:hypothetical protein
VESFVAELRQKAQIKERNALLDQVRIQLPNEAEATADVQQEGVPGAD